ncbi:MAG: hypothetical protein LBJ73_02815 [Rickettsiales bacterium]|jgi:hypothetical protein|nr:hypothetical protein [Rickettsiales bacterium]
MSRNTEMKFAGTPAPKIERTVFPSMEFNYKGSFNVGQIIPFFCYMDILPTDTIKASIKAVIRKQTSLVPAMDVLNTDVYFFNIRKRILWNHWNEFCGENKTGAWSADIEYLEPQFTAPTGGMLKGSIADHMGITKKTAGIKFSQFGVRAYVMTYNEWFRDQNLIAPEREDKGDNDLTASNTDTTYGGIPFKAAKLHDYFTSGLPGPQKGDAVQIPLGTSAPIKTNIEELITGVQNAMTLRLASNGNKPGNSQASLNNGKLAGVTDTAGLTTGYVYPSNLYADLLEATAATVSTQTLSFQLQKAREKDALYGTRLFEVLRGHFGIMNPEAVMQRPEYLGGERFQLTDEQIPQTSATSGQSPQATLAAYSLTNFNKHLFTKSFNEHSVLMGLIVVRQYHTYQQGLPRQWSRRRRFDHYWPVMQALRERPTYMKEIYATGVEEHDMAVHSYQEAWAEYRHGWNWTAGAMNSTYEQPLDQWHYGDIYSSDPILSKEWIEETPEYVDRNLAVKSTTEDQLWADIKIELEMVRPMPLYSRPGYIDHF